MFPSSVNLMVLDSNMGKHSSDELNRDFSSYLIIYTIPQFLVDPGVDIEQWAIDSARSKNQRIEYFISACDRNPGLCPVPNMRECFSAMNDLIKVNANDLVSTCCS